MTHHNLIQQQVGSTKVSQMLPTLRMIASQWGLNINRAKHFAIAKKIAINSIAKN